MYSNGQCFSPSPHFVPDILKWNVMSQNRDMSPSLLAYHQLSRTFLLTRTCSTQIVEPCFDRSFLIPVVLQVLTAESWGFGLQPPQAQLSTVCNTRPTHWCLSQTVQGNAVICFKHKVPDCFKDIVQTLIILLCGSRCFSSRNGTFLVCLTSTTLSPSGKSEMQLLRNWPLRLEWRWRFASPTHSMTWTSESASPLSISARKQLHLCVRQVFNSFCAPAGS